MAYITYAKGEERMTFEVIAYEDVNGKIPVQKFLKKLNPKMRAKMYGQPELDVIRAMVDARNSVNMTQKELSDRTGISQADISKIENGTRNPSLNLLKRLAEGMGMTLKIEFVPKHSAICNTNTFEKSKVFAETAKR